MKGLSVESLPVCSGCLPPVSLAALGWSRRGKRCTCQTQSEAEEVEWRLVVSSGPRCELTVTDGAVDSSDLEALGLASSRP